MIRWIENTGLPRCGPQIEGRDVKWQLGGNTLKTRRSILGNLRWTYPGTIKKKGHERPSVGCRNCDADGDGCATESVD